MLKKVFLLVLICSSLAVVEGVAAMQVVDAAISSAIENQQPVDRISAYPADFGKLYCFTRIVGAVAETSVTHIWYFKDHVMAKVVLPVGSGNWRTYSSKRFLPQWAGQWVVKVVDDGGNELAKIPFVLE